MVCILLLLMHAILIAKAQEEPSVDNEYCKISKENIACRTNKCQNIASTSPLKVCKFRLLNELERSLVLDTHNGIRNELAHGEHNSTYLLGPGRNINTLSYDKEAEFLAVCGMIETTKNNQSVFYGVKPGRSLHYGFNSFDTKINTLKINTWRSILVKLAAEYWFKQIKYLKPDDVQKTIEKFDLARVQIEGSRNVPYFTQLIWADTKYVGCALVRDVTTKYINADIMCTYYPPGNIQGQSVYKMGTTAYDCKHRNPIFKNLCGPIIAYSDDKYVSPLNKLFPPTEDRVLGAPRCTDLFIFILTALIFLIN